MSFFKGLTISATGLTAERLRMDLISNNVANANTTKTASGTPYRRKLAVMQEIQDNSFSQIMSRASGNSGAGSGVEIAKIVEDKSDFKRIYDPTHPDADSKGYVLMPNVNTVSEMVDLISANRAYDANVTVINSTKAMLMKALDIGR